MDSSEQQKPRLAVSFSGGRSSAVMVDQILGKWGNDRDISITFANTGREESATLDFVHAVDLNLCRPRGHRVVWLEAVTRGPGKGPAAAEVTYETASRNGEPFEAAIAKHGIPCKTHPNCTGRLKVEPMAWWYRHVKEWMPGTYDTAIGIRADEIDRVSSTREKKRLIYPLADWGFRKRDVINYMSRFPWDLQLPGEHWGNCDCCWKKSLRKLMTRAKEDPHVFSWWGRMERKYGTVNRGDGEQEEPRVFFREKRSAQDILALAMTEDFQPWEDARDNIPFDAWWDLGSGCGESCEIGADEEDAVDDDTDSTR
jgi:hypothetical protein